MADGWNFRKWLQDSVFKPLEDKKMPVMEHLVELQVRLTRAVIVVGIIFVATFFYADKLVHWLMALPMYVFYEVGILSAGFFKRAVPKPAATPVSKGPVASKPGPAGVRT